MTQLKPGWVIAAGLAAGAADRGEQPPPKRTVFRNGTIEEQIAKRRAGGRNGTVNRARARKIDRVLGKVEEET